MWAGNVNRGTVKANLFWFVVVVLLATFHGCVAVQWLNEDAASGEPTIPWTMETE